MPKIALNDAIVRSLKPGMYFDTKTPAFGLRVGKHRKTWIVLRGTKSAKVSLGHYPAVPLIVARKLALVQLGSSYETASMTFPEAREQYLENLKLSPRALYEATRILNRYFHWKKKLDQITHNDVASVIDNIEAPSEALHAYKNLRTFFNWCVPRYIKVSPLAGLKPPSKYVPRQRTLSEAEIKLVWKLGEGQFGNLLKLALLTGARQGELLKLKWVDVTTTITFRKTKNGLDHSIPLTKTADKLLKSIPRTSAFVFPSGDGSAPYNGGGKAMWEFRQIPAIAALPPFTFHDTRRSFAHQWQKLGIRLELTEAALNHKGSRGGIVGVYQTYGYEKELVECYSRWDAKLVALTR